MKACITGNRSTTRRGFIKASALLCGLGLTACSTDDSEDVEVVESGEGSESVSATAEVGQEEVAVEETEVEEPEDETVDADVDGMTDGGSNVYYSVLQMLEVEKEESTDLTEYLIQMAITNANAYDIYVAIECTGSLTYTDDYGDTITDDGTVCYVNSPGYGRVEGGDMTKIVLLAGASVERWIHIYEYDTPHTMAYGNRDCTLDNVSVSFTNATEFNSECYVAPEDIDFSVELHEAGEGGSIIDNYFMVEMSNPAGCRCSYLAVSFCHVDDEGVPVVSSTLGQLETDTLKWTSVKADETLTGNTDCTYDVYGTLRPICAVYTEDTSYDE